MSELMNTKISKELALEFFLVFSRAEFALKAAGYAQETKGEVKPDWDRFARELKDIFNPTTSEELDTACAYYIGLPPQKQVFKDGSLGWKKSLPKQRSLIEILIIFIRRVRNNLFHGGKFSPQNFNETERNEYLLAFALCILKEAVHLNPKVKQVYDMAAI